MLVLILALFYLGIIIVLKWKLWKMQSLLIKITVCICDYEKLLKQRFNKKWLKDDMLFCVIYLIQSRLSSWKLWMNSRIDVWRRRKSLIRKLFLTVCLQTLIPTYHDADLASRLVRQFEQWSWVFLFPTSKTNQYSNLKNIFSIISLFQSKETCQKTNSSIRKM
jgi:hypothetical protein